MAICVIGGILLGNFLDSIFNTRPILLIIMTISGVAASIKQLYTMALGPTKDRNNQEDNKEDK